MYFTPFSSVSIAQATFEQVNVSYVCVCVCVFVCVCVCVCVCLRVNHHDVIRLGVRLTKVFLAYATTSPGRVASHSNDPW